MYVGADFDPQDGAETDTYTLNFSRDLQPLEVITQSTWTVAVVTGTDASASSRLNGAATIDSTGTITSQRFSGLLSTCTYRLTAAVTTNFGNVKSLWSHAPGVAPN